MAISPVDYAVISQALLSAAREMGVKLCRSAYSSIVRDAKDASTGILDASGNAIAQSDELIPILVGSLSTAFRHCAAAKPVNQLVEGDFYITNHPYRGGHHLNDVFLFLPIFVDSKIVGFSAAVAHHIDVGGGTGLTNGASDLFQEGLVLPPLCCNIGRDWSGGLLEMLIRSNVRAPEQTIGDLNSQFAACNTGAGRVRELCAKYGTDKIRAVMSEMLDYTERRVRAAISTIPDGVYTASDALDDDGITGRPLTVSVTVTVSGDTMEVDFGGTSEQAKGNLNAPLASTISSTMTAIKAVVTGGDVPYNEGAYRPITITVPPGSLLNPRYPAPVFARMEAIYRAFDSVLKALGQAIPDRVMACGYDSTYHISLSHLAEDGYRVFAEVNGGGWGASGKGDGADGIAQPLSNCANVPVELIDMGYDYFRIERYALIAGSGGKGRYRGGMGLERTYRILKDDVRFFINADRFDAPAEGLEGGAAGSRASCVVQRGDEVISFRSMGSGDLKAGDLVILKTGGGGGFGAPSAPLES